MSIIARGNPCLPAFNDSTSKVTRLEMSPYNLSLVEPPLLFQPLLYSGLYSFSRWLWRFEPRSHFKRLSLIVRVNVVLNRTAVVDSDWHFDNLCGSHLQSQSELYHLSWWYCTLVIEMHRLSKRQSLSTTTVLFRTTFTRTIKLNLFLTMLSRLI